MIAVVDTGPLVASVDADDDDHQQCLDVLERGDLELIVPALVVAEASYLIETRLGPQVEAAFIRGLSTLEVEAPYVGDWPAIANLIERYADFPLGATDASIAVLAERLGTDIVVTLDRRHFSAIRQSNGRTFTLLPE